MPMEAPLTFGSALCGSASVRALWATFLLNSVFTGAQFAGSIISNSVALGADTGTMAVDSLTYLINIVAEVVRIRGASPRTSELIDATASGLSVIALIVVCALAVDESVGRLTSEAGDSGSGDGSGDAEDINAPVMFAFTFGNLIIDIGMLGSILLRKRGGWMGVLTCRTCRQRGDEDLLPSDTTTNATPILAQDRCAQSTTSSSALPPAEPAADTACGESAGEELNVFSALSHVVADTMRTVTEMACSLLIWADHRVNGEMADAISALVVSAIILLIAAFILWETSGLIRKACSMSKTGAQQEPNVPTVW